MEIKPKARPNYRKLPPSKLTFPDGRPFYEGLDHFGKMTDALTRLQGLLQVLSHVDTEKACPKPEALKVLFLELATLANEVKDRRDQCWKSLGSLRLSG